MFLFPDAEGPVVDDRIEPLTMTDTTVAALRELLKEPDTEIPAAQIARAIGLPPGPAGQIIARLADANWVVTTKLPRRKVRLTADGVDAARRAVDGHPEPVTREMRQPTPPAPRRTTEMTLPELRAAVASGEVGQDVLESVLRQLRKT